VAPRLWFGNDNSPAASETAAKAAIDACLLARPTLLFDTSSPLFELAPGSPLAG
jgi:hypothetical protein